MGTYAYASGFGPRCVIVKVNPADVVSVPEACQCQKVRTSRYTVVALAYGALTRSLESADRTTLESPELRARLDGVQAGVDDLQAEIDALQEELRAKVTSAAQLPPHDKSFGPFIVYTITNEGALVREETDIEDLFSAPIQTLMRASEQAGLTVQIEDAEGNEVDTDDVLDN